MPRVEQHFHLEYEAFMRVIEELPDPNTVPASRKHDVINIANPPRLPQYIPEEDEVDMLATTKVFTIHTDVMEFVDRRGRREKRWKIKAEFVI